MRNQTFLDKLIVSKTFDVKTPVSFEQRGEQDDNYSIGIDLHMPECTRDFITKFCVMNSNLEVNGDFDEQKFCSWDEDENSVSFFVQSQVTFEREYVMTYDKEKRVYHIFSNVAIPLGIQVLCPENCWLEIRSKSSNFKNGFTIIHGTGDMNYTFGYTAQLVPFKKRVTIEVGQKICQMVCVEARVPRIIEEITREEFEKLDAVNRFRGVRKGGFGSTGKF